MVDFGSGAKGKAFGKDLYFYGIDAFGGKFMTVFLVCLGCGLCVVVWGSFSGCRECKRVFEAGFIS